MAIIKRLARFVGYCRATPHWLTYQTGCVLFGRERAFPAASERISRIPGLLGVYARQAFYRCTLRHTGEDVYFGFMSVLSKPDARIGDRVYIGRFCTIGLAEIGDDTLLADAVQVLSGRHQHGRAAAGGPPHDQAPQFTRVTIGAGAWLGAGAIVMADIGDQAVVAAGAVVVKPVENGSRVGGVPARPLNHSAVGQ